MLCDERASLRRECILNNANRPQHLVLGGIIASYDIAWDRRFELRQERNEINCLDDFRPLEVSATKWVSCPENRKKTKIKMLHTPQPSSKMRAEKSSL
jgi:hypothetical protein